MISVATLLTGPSAWARVPCSWSRSGSSAAPAQTTVEAASVPGPSGWPVAWATCGAGGPSSATTSVLPGTNLGADPGAAGNDLGGPFASALPRIAFTFGLAAPTDRASPSDSADRGPTPQQ